mgnify:CR=1 FL=1
MAVDKTEPITAGRRGARSFVAARVGRSSSDARARRSTSSNEELPPVIPMEQLVSSPLEPQTHPTRLARLKGKLLHRTKPKDSDRARGAAVTGLVAAEPPASDERWLLWEDCPLEVVWLVQSQVRCLLTHDPQALLLRPSGHVEMEQDHSTGVPFESSWAAVLAESAVRDPVLMPRLQQALTRFVPSQISRLGFWENFIAHVDVIKLAIVSDFLHAKKATAAAKRERRVEWIRAFEQLDPEIRANPPHAARDLSRHRIPPAASPAELAFGFIPENLPQWSSKDAAWLDYVEDGGSRVNRPRLRTTRPSVYATRP